MFDYWLWDEALPKWFCEEQIKSIDWSGSQKGHIKKGIDEVVDEELRVTDILWLDSVSPIGCIAQFYVNQANKLANWNYDVEFCEQIQIGKYSGDTKGFYGWHQDNGFKVNSQGLVRKMSLSILLSDPKEFEGGLLEFKDFDEQPILKQGSIIVFSSFLEHQVTPVTSGTRYSAVTWVSGPAYK